MNTKVRKGGEGGIASGAGAGISLHPTEDPMPEQVEISRRNCSPQRGAMQEQAYAEGLQAVERTHGGAGEKREEEGAIERSCYRLTATPHSPLPCTASGQGEVEELGVKV